MTANRNKGKHRAPITSKSTQPKWCKRCGRKHPRSQVCDLVRVPRVENGQSVTRVVPRGEEHMIIVVNGSVS